MKIPGRLPGQKILWEFEVKKEGWYQIGFRYCQPSESLKPVYRAMEIDGRTPFAELDSVAFPATDTGEYKNLIVKDESNTAACVFGGRSSYDCVACDHGAIG